MCIRDRVSAGLICFNTNLAAALATVAALIVSWVRYGKPDVSLTFNGALAGLVAITAGCDVVDPFGAAIIGIVAGVLCIFSVEFFDNVAKIDDPVGAVSVHCMNLSLIHIFPIIKRIIAQIGRAVKGRVCGGLPFVGCDGSFALISRLRAAASPEGEAKKS